MKKLFWIVICLFALVGPVHAFLYDLKILSSEEIKVLTDDQLMNFYTEAKIEEKASAEFHVGAGFSSSKDYEKRKDLLKYIIELRREMKKRELEPEPLDEWLK